MTSTLKKKPDEEIPDLTGTTIAKRFTLKK